MNKKVRGSIKGCDLLVKNLDIFLNPEWDSNLYKTKIAV